MLASSMSLTNFVYLLGSQERRLFYPRNVKGLAGETVNTKHEDL